MTITLSVCDMFICVNRAQHDNSVIANAITCWALCSFADAGKNVLECKY